MRKDSWALPIAGPAPAPLVRDLADADAQCLAVSAENPAAARSRAELGQEVANTGSRPSLVERMVDKFTRDTWEIRHLRGIKSAVARGACEHAFELLTELVLSGGGGPLRVDDPKTAQKCQEDLAQKSRFIAMVQGIDGNLISTDAFDLARLDKLLHLIEARREDGIRRLARHSPHQAARLRGIIESEVPI
jgi:hypothetical protein